MPVRCKEKYEKRCFEGLLPAAFGAESFYFHPCPDKFSQAGQCWEIAPAVGSGYYWVYAKQDLFDIKIHDFFFHEDQCLDMAIPECISIQRYDSISGEELNPYRRLSAGDIQTIVGGKRATARSSTSAFRSIPWVSTYSRIITRIF